MLPGEIVRQRQKLELRGGNSNALHLYLCLYFLLVEIGKSNYLRKLCKGKEGCVSDPNLNPDSSTYTSVTFAKCLTSPSFDFLMWKGRSAPLLH